MYPGNDEIGSFDVIVKLAPDFNGAFALIGTIFDKQSEETELAADTGGTFTLTACP